MGACADEGKRPAGTTVPGAKTNWRVAFGSLLRLTSASSSALVEVLNSSIQSEVVPSALVRDLLLARISLSTTGTPTVVVVMMFVVNWIALNSIPKTSSLLVLAPQQETWCTSTAIRLSPMTRLFVAK